MSTFESDSNTHDSPTAKLLTELFAERWQRRAEDGVIGTLREHCANLVELAMETLDALGELRPSTVTAREQWTVRHTSEINGERLAEPLATRELAEQDAAFWRRVSATRRTYPIRVEIMRRDVYDLPGGSSWYGPWRVVDDTREEE